VRTHTHTPTHKDEHWYTYTQSGHEWVHVDIQTKNECVHTHTSRWTLAHTHHDGHWRTQRARRNSWTHRDTHIRKDRGAHTGRARRNACECTQQDEHWCTHTENV